MNKTFLATSIYMLAFVILSFSQTGIGTRTAMATLDVVGVAGNVTVPDGIIVPRLSGDQLAGKNAIYGASQNATMVYITSAASAVNQTGKTLNVKAAGYYFYDAGASQWKLVNHNIYNADGALISNRIVTMQGNSLTFTGANADTVGITKFINTTGTSLLPKPAIQIKDGAQAKGKILMSDFNGNASWQPTSVIPHKKIIGTLINPGEGVNNVILQGSGTLTSSLESKSIHPRNMGSNIVLPSGLWEVEINIIIELPHDILTLDNYIFTKFSLGLNSSNANMLGITTSSTEPYFEGARLFGSSMSTVSTSGVGSSTSQYFSIVNGKLIVRNPTANPVTLYLILAQVIRKHYAAVPINLTMRNLATGSHGENYIRASRIEF